MAGLVLITLIVCLTIFITTIAYKIVDEGYLIRSGYVEDSIKNIYKCIHEIDEEIKTLREEVK